MTFRNSKVWNVLSYIYHRIRDFYNKNLAKISILFFRNYVIEKEFEGFLFQFKISDRCARDWYDDDRTTTPETSFICKHLLKPGDVVADCGAHHGLITLLAAKTVGAGGQIFAFEPLPQNAVTIRRNIRLNKLKNVYVENLAVGESNRKVNFLDDSNGYITNNNSGSKTINVNMITLDKFFRGRNYPSFLKIDVEGYENQLLIGAHQILMKAPRFALEFHTGYHKDPKKELKKMYELFNFDRYNIFIQMEIDGPIIPMNDKIHTPKLLVRYQNMHFFGIPKEL